MILGLEDEATSHTHHPRGDEGEGTEEPHTTSDHRTPGGFPFIQRPPSPLETHCCTGREEEDDRPVACRDQRGDDRS